MIGTENGGRSFEDRTFGHDCRMVEHAKAFLQHIPLERCIVEASVRHGELIIPETERGTEENLPSRTGGAGSF